MHIVRKEIATISVAHRLRGIQRCEWTHGHNFKAWLTVCSEKLDSFGMVVNFTDVGQFNRMWSMLDHRELNQDEDSEVSTLPHAQMPLPLREENGLLVPAWILDTPQGETIVTPWPSTAENLAVLLFGWASEWFARSCPSVRVLEAEIGETDGNIAKYIPG